MKVTVFTAPQGTISVPVPVYYPNSSAELSGGCLTISTNGAPVAYWGAGSWQHAEIGA